MSKIHRPPRGLQHLLGSQSFGQNPDELAQTVQPTISMDGFYSAELLKTAEVIGALSDDGQIGKITFQAPVALIACGLEFGTALAANENFFFDFRMDGLGGTGQEVVVHKSERQTYISGGYPTEGFFLPYPLVVPGGASIEAFVTSDSPFGLSTITVRAIYVDLNPVDDY